jgi:methyl-accepting chemotaxis protein
MTVVRWTDEMLDTLASSVVNLRDSITEVRDSITEVRDSVTEVRDSVTEVRDSITEVRDSVDGLRVTVQALLQVAAQSQRDMELMKQRQEENDQRFNILLDEVRYLRRGNQGS